jgi:hypothetical protein
MVPSWLEDSRSEVRDAHLSNLLSGPRRQRSSEESIEVGKSSDESDLSSDFHLEHDPHRNLYE